MVIMKVMEEIWIAELVIENRAEQLEDRKDISDQDDQGYTWKEKILYLAY